VEVVLDHPLPLLGAGGDTLRAQRGGYLSEPQERDLADGDELNLLAVNTNLSPSPTIQDVAGQIFALFILTVAAANPLLV
jgi:hypothetical protein